MTDKELEELIQKESENIVIKTTAQDILKKHEDQKKKTDEKLPWYKTKAFRYGAPAFGIVLIVSVSLGTYFGVINNSHTSESGNPINSTDRVAIPLNNPSIRSASYEVLAGVSFLAGQNQNVQGAYRRIDNDYFTSICKAFNENYEMIRSLESYSDTGFNYTPVQSTDSSMPYCIQIEDFYLYYDQPIQDEDETYIRGYTTDLDNNRMQTVFIEREQESDKDETEDEIEVTLIAKDNSSVIIERASETEGGESESEFSLIQKDSKGRTISEISFELEVEGLNAEKTFDIDTLNGQEVEWSYTLFNETEEGMDIAFEADETEIDRRNPIRMTFNPRSYVYGEFTYQP